MLAATTVVADRPAVRTLADAGGWVHDARRLAGHARAARCTDLRFGRTGTAAVRVTDQDTRLVDAGLAGSTGTTDPKEVIANLARRAVRLAAAEGAIAHLTRRAHRGAHTGRADLAQITRINARVSRWLTHIAVTAGARHT
jgi:hypothetical protein